MLTHVDLFSGIGGFALAAQWAGFRTVVFCEIDEFCQKILGKYWPEIPIQKDIGLFDWHGGEKPTLITGGPPCQGTSVAAAIQNKRTGESPWPQMARVIEHINPVWIIVEQPAGNKAWEDQVALSLASLGYKYSKFKRQASDCGAPHSRRRVFFVANASRQRLDAFSRLRESSASDTNTWPPPPRGAWRSARTGDGGMDDGIPDWVDRIRALGNAIVPQVAHQILKGIAEIENGKS